MPDPHRRRLREAERQGKMGKVSDDTTGGRPGKAGRVSAAAPAAEDSCQNGEKVVKRRAPPLDGVKQDG
jgi:hypothetical protein